MENEIVKKGFKSLFIILFLTEIVGYAIFLIWFKKYYFDFYPFLSFIFCCLGTITILGMAKASKADKLTFYNVFLTIKVIKFLVLLTVAVLYAILCRTNLVSFFIVFVVLYLVYTIFETKFSIYLNRSKDESNISKNK